MLIVCAGMQYAAYVENVHGKRVLVDSKLLAERLADKAFGKRSKRKKWKPKCKSNVIFTRSSPNRPSAQQSGWCVPFRNASGKCANRRCHCQNALRIRCADSNRIILLHVYVPRININDGRKVADKNRIGEIENLILDFVRDFDNTEYLIETDGTPYSTINEDIEQHLIVARLKFQRITND